jgi:hypothetical protein
VLLDGLLLKCGFLASSFHLSTHMRFELLAGITVIHFVRAER